jgi:hypothetical protein
MVESLSGHQAQVAHLHLDVEEARRFPADVHAADVVIGEVL